MFGLTWASQASEYRVRVGMTVAVFHTTAAGTLAGTLFSFGHYLVRDIGGPMPRPTIADWAPVGSTQGKLTHTKDRGLSPEYQLHRMLSQDTSYH